MNENGEKKFKWTGKETEPKRTQSTDQRNAGRRFAERENRTKRNISSGSTLSGSTARLL